MGLATVRHGCACSVRGLVRGGRRRLALAGLVSTLAAAGGLALGCVPASAATAAFAGTSVATTTTLTATPNPANAGATVTLTADTSAADGTNPAGTVQFTNNGTDIGSAVSVNASGVATITTTFAASGQMALTAAFFPTNSSSYFSSQGTATETVYPAGTTAAGSEPVAVSVPPGGAFTLTVAPGTVDLAVSGLTATGTLQDITVSDTRNTYPGWSVSGQTSDFTGSGTAAGSTVSGNQLGWVPIVVGSLEDGATLGGTVAPASPGLGSTAATLASAAANCGFGTNVMSANLTLAIPSLATAGPYGSIMTITAVVTGPADEFCVPVGIGV
jgi:hypothetical protein